MGLAIRKKSEDLMLVHFTGFLKNSDQEEYEMIGRLEMDGSRQTKILINATGFSGWGTDCDWSDREYMHEYDPYIEKIAVVADEKWKEQALIFLRSGKRQASVAFFSPSQAQDARDWLQAENHVLANEPFGNELRSRNV